MFYLEKTKMAKLSTGKKLGLERAQNVFAEVGTKYIKDWTSKELRKFVTEPVVIPVGNYGFLVGPYRIIGIDKNCWSVEQLDNKHIHNFVTKINAILFCLKSMKHIHSAQEICELDRKLGFLDNDIARYKNILAKNNNQFKTAVTLNRYIEAKEQRRQVLNILKKTLISAKYLNFGNKPL